MDKRELQFGDVVQIDPEHHIGERQGFFAACFMLVTEPKPWGAQGFICMPGSRGTVPGSAYYRAKWEEMEYVGRATFVPKRDEEDDDAPAPGYHQPRQDSGDDGAPPAL